MNELDLGPRDEATLRERGIAREEAERQLALLRAPAAPRRLVRPCALGDGIVRIDEQEHAELIGLHEEVAAKGLVGKLVPASGAATRMFRDLLAQRGSEHSFEKIVERAAAGDAEARALQAFLERLEDFAFEGELSQELERRGEARASERFRAILEALLHEEGLGYAARPKALLPFHRYESGSRTPLEEHLVEASALVRDAAGLCRVWFTVSPEERRQFEALLARAVPSLERELGVRFAVHLSEQRRSTETLAIDSEGRPFRDAGGALVLRPGGHGALLANLAEVDVPFVQLKNIDNVAHDPLRRPGILWKRLLTGATVRLQREAAKLADEVAAGGSPALAAARGFLHERFGTDLPVTAPVEAVRDALERPIRVCGVVRNEGEPGGGPFWVEGRDGQVRRQIVESAEIDASSSAQHAIFAAATHFNPVDITCALANGRGERYDLRRFVDRDAAIVTRKSFEGRELLALELPGLWNGSMSGWNTVFVEVPGATFTPVKTVLDLLRPDHAPPR